MQIAQNQSDKNEMAMLRFSLIAPVINNTYTQVSKRAYYQDVAQKPVVLPNGSQIYFNPNTLSTWESKYRRFGFEGLCKMGRSDAGCARSIDTDQAEAIGALKERYPKMNATQIRLKLIEEGLMNANATSVSSVQRFIKRNFVRDAQNSQVKDRKAFEEEFSNAMWQADTLFGPFVRTPGSKGVKRSYLQMILDDKSRMIVAGRFYKADNAVNFQATLKAAVSTYGIPRKLYVDNGAPYRNEALVGVCGRIGCVLIHAPVRDGASKGKIERNFRTLRERYLNCLETTSKTYTLDELNDSLCNYITQHNKTVHSAHHARPIDVWTADASKTSPRMPTSPEWLCATFRNREYRRVRRDATVLINKVSFDAPAHMIGARIEVAFTPGDATDVWAIDEDKTLIPMQLTDKVANSRAKRANPYSIDYTKE